MNKQTKQKPNNNVIIIEQDIGWDTGCLALETGMYT